MTSASPNVRPFQLPLSAEESFTRPFVEHSRKFVEWALGFDTLNSIYSQVSKAQQASFPRRALESLSVTIDVRTEDLAQVPESGPLIVIANHPFGGLDGLVLLDLLQRVRPDVKLLANHLLGCIPELRESCILVDPFGGPDAVRRNCAAMREALRWVQNGGVLGIFPAGEVSHLSLARRCVSDPTWSPMIARIIHRSGADVLPCFFEGRNGSAFQLAGLIHPRLRTAMLPRELLSKRGTRLHVELGRAIRNARLAEIGGHAADRMRDDEAGRVTEYLRMRTYLLRGRKRHTPRSSQPGSRLAEQPIDPPQPPNLIAAEIDALPSDACLARSGAFRVFCATASQIPAVMREIGRLREITFRQVGEGTGKSLDLDRFDQHYLHLFAWDDVQCRIVGAYRIAAVDDILRQHGVAGLYTQTLFQFGPRLLKQLHSALELGRSFVVKEYQRNYAPLMLLWKAIAAYVARHPRYHLLIGAVSISDDFNSTTKQLLMAFMRANCLHTESAQVQPRNPPRFSFRQDFDPARLSTLISDISSVDKLVEELETDQRGIPVLLRQYLKLNARILGFNVDPQFGNVLDGLMLVDLLTVDRTILNRYLGGDAARSFLAYHRVAQS